MKIPILVRLHAKVSPAWKQFDLETLHRMSRCGSSLSAIANSLPALWYYQLPLREPILALFVKNDERIGRSVHQNLGTGNRSPLKEGESDLIPTDEELEGFSNVFSVLCDGLLSLPKSERESLLTTLAWAIEETKTEIEIEARTLEYHQSYVPPVPRKRRPFQKTT